MLQTLPCTFNLVADSNSLAVGEIDPFALTLAFVAEVSEMRHGLNAFAFGFGVSYDPGVVVNMFSNI